MDKEVWRVADISLWRLWIWNCSFITISLLLLLPRCWEYIRHGHNSSQAVKVEFEKMIWRREFNYALYVAHAKNQMLDKAIYLGCPIKAPFQIFSSLAPYTIKTSSKVQFSSIQATFPRPSFTSVNSTNSISTRPNFGFRNTVSIDRFLMKGKINYHLVVKPRKDLQRM